jgi:hypothetical protein
MFQPTEYNSKRPALSVYYGFAIGCFQQASEGIDSVCLMAQ